MKKNVHRDAQIVKYTPRVIFTAKMLYHTGTASNDLLVGVISDPLDSLRMKLPGCVHVKCHNIG